MFMVPLFSLFPVPRGFALLTVTGRRSGRRRQRPVRAVRQNHTLYAVAMMGKRSDWLRNVRKEPRIGIKLGRRRHEGLAREVTVGAEQEAALELYVQNVFPADYSDYAAYHWGWPTRRKIKEAHRRWFADGVAVAIDLQLPREERHE
jgi:deazaflavin-dependent oxidoreductase (nitroreductase family)